MARMPSSTSLDLVKKHGKLIKLKAACQLWQNRRVYRIQAIHGSFQALVLDDTVLPHQVHWQENKNQVTFDCDCKTYGELPCKHVWALLFELRQRSALVSPVFKNLIGAYLEQRNVAGTLPGREFLRTRSLFEHQTSTPASHQLSLFDQDESAEPSQAPLLTNVLIAQTSALASSSTLRSKVANPIQTRTVAIVRPALAHRNELSLEFGEEVCDQERFEPMPQWIEDLIGHAKSSAVPLVRLFDCHYQRVSRSAEQTPSDLAELSYWLRTESRRPINISILSGLKLRGRLVKTQNDAIFPSQSSPRMRYVFECAANGQAQFDALSLWSAESDWLYHYQSKDRQLLILRHPQAASWWRSQSNQGYDYSLEQLAVAAEYASKTCSDVISFELPTHLPVKLLHLNPRPILSLGTSSDRTEISLSFAYGNQEVNLRDEREVIAEASKDQDSEDNQVQAAYWRKRDQEQTHLGRLRSLVDDILLFEGGLYASLLSHSPVADLSLSLSFKDFVLERGQELMQDGFELRYEGRRMNTSSGLAFKAEHGIDWFGLRTVWKKEGHSLGLTLLNDPQSFKSGLSRGQDPEGNECWIVMGKNDLERLRVLSEMGMDKNGLLHTSPVNISLINSFYQEVENQDHHSIVSARQLCLSLEELRTKMDGEDFSSLPFEVPQGLKAQLRPYQLAGYNWLRLLHQNQVGACLADDMGLGKTIQTIALLLSLKEQNNLGPSILIAPVVTIPNWEDEILRFAPSLSIRRHGGSDRLRSVEELLSQDSKSGQPPDLILTSYHTLRNDLHIFVKHQWDYLILDEAHYIKNASSQLFKAVKVLPSKHRLSLTGTPLENSTLELWSQFSFLNPGLLGIRRKFASEFAQRIEKDADEESLEMLRSTVAPFILRRRKQDVLHDLPPKEEIIFRTEMASQQAELYEKHRETFRQELEGVIDQKGLQHSRMDVLRAMLRLRQIAIHPAMVKGPDGLHPYANVPSCKLDALSMLLDESVDEGHKTLVFSQFVSALNLIAAQLDSTKCPYALLTGATKDRRAEVESFRNDARLNVFLLSLKAGGVGINLTKADNVVLFDPWWNPAAERQAVDRAHRMGQRNPVVVYKFITSGTIEEKIVQLQERKHLLIGSLIAGDQVFASNLNGEDVLNLFT